MARQFSPARLRDLRNHAGLTREKLAVAAGMSMTSIAHHEQGERIPGLNAAARLAEALGITVDALLGDPSEGQGGH